MARVLVIEDDEGMRGVIRRALELAGHTVYEGVDGADGFDSFLRQRLDLVITDLVMPNQDGIETIHRVKRLDAGMPVVAISGFGGLQEAVEAGAHALEKPFDVRDLVGLVGQLTRQTSSEREGSA